MQNSENKGSLSDKFRDFGAAPTEGLWDAISGGLDADNSARQKGPKGSKAFGKSLFWAATGFVAASAIATGLWLTSSKETAVNSTTSPASGQSHSSNRAAQPTAGTFAAPGTQNASVSADKTSASKPAQQLTSDQQSSTAGAKNKKTPAALASGKSPQGSGNKHYRRQYGIGTDKQKRQQRTDRNDRVWKPLYSSEKEGMNEPRMTPGEQQYTDKTVGDDRKGGDRPGIDPTADPDNNLTGNNTLPDDDPLANSVTGTDRQSLASGTPGVENDSIPGSTSPATAHTGSESGTGPLADSSPKGGAATPIRRTLPPPPPKWMIGGHIGLNYGKEVYLIDFQNDQYSLSNADMYAYSPAKYLSTHLYRSADITVSRRVSRRFWLESGIQAGMLYAKQEPDPSYVYYQPVEGKVFNLGVPLAVRFDFNRRGKLQFYQRIGTLHTFPYAINARYTYLNKIKPDIWLHRNYWAYTLSVYCNFGMEWEIARNLYWDTRVELRFMSEMVSMYRNYNNTTWLGGSTGIVWKF